ncbi:probable disease resistance protein At4g27220 [Prunus avium]|uniref:Probable disease resistance protein At4g27220 n=1 Tax=Prunus avium TaxID=42229 RepID=A0A6P5TL63_PRUAV|nr:probable disease resistance protein At4g27220 [Prunus avium]
MGTEFGCLTYCGPNIEDLKDEFKKLIVKKDELQELVNEAKRKGEVINPHVLNWLSMVEEMNSEVSRFEDEVKRRRRCLNWLSLSRTAQKIKQHVLHLLKEGKFQNIAHPAAPQIQNVARPAAPQTIRPTLTAGVRGPKSRITVMNHVLEALKNEKIRMVGICGMDGVGKTLMAEEIIQIVQGKLFDAVVKIVVSPNPNITKIQAEIADKGRERILCERILIVLDDVWSVLDFEAIGLPLGPSHKGCKVLLTSSNLDVCYEMGSQKNFTLPMLTTEEAWELFQETIGEPLDADPDLCGIAKALTNECGGLPFSVVTIAKELQNNKSKYEWANALQQLKAHEIPPQAYYSNIKLCYERLENDELKSCFLLCCLFPQGYDIPIDYLVRYAWGQGIISDRFDSVEAARMRVHFLVVKLKRRFLLLDSSKEGCTKMHGVVHGVAISIASQDMDLFMVQDQAGYRSWQIKPPCKQYTAVSLNDVNIDNRIVTGLGYQKLELLQLKNTHISESSLESMLAGMMKLQVLYLLHTGFSGLSTSIRVLPRYLRTLSLDDCALGDISSVWKLENLEILSFARSNIKVLPKEVAHLQQLRLLDTTDCSYLKEIPRGILSTLSKLEELYMTRSFNKWEPAEEVDLSKEGEIRMASLAEVMSLTSKNLTVLAIDIPDFKLFPEDEVLLKKETTRFHISICKANTFRMPQPLDYGFKNTVKLVGDAKEFIKNGDIRFLLKYSRALYFREAKNLNCVLNDQVSFQGLEALSIQNSKQGTESLISDRTGETAFLQLKSLELNEIPDLIAIWQGQLQNHQSFGNLRSLQISCCSELRCAFPVSIARNLVQLQSLVVYLCEKMQEIVSNEGMEDEIDAPSKVAFPNLTELNLSGVSNLVSFYIANQPCNSKPEMAETWSSNQGNEAGGSSSKKSKILLPPYCISWLKNLEELEVKLSSKIEVLFDLEGQMVQGNTEEIPVSFTQLRKVCLTNLNQLAHLWKNVPCRIRCFENLRFLTVLSCDSLKYLFSYSVAKQLVGLEELKISYCRTMKTIVELQYKEEIESTRILFPKLSLRLEDLSSLVSLSEGVDADNTFVWPSTRVTPSTTINESDDSDNLECLEVEDCESLQVIFQPKESNYAHKFTKIKRLVLKALPMLIDIWEMGSQQIDGFRNLRWLEVHGCEQMTYLFSPSIVKLLISLEQIKVMDCWMMEEIVAETEAEHAEEIELPLVNSIMLRNLPNFKRVCTEAYTLKCPSLAELVYIECNPKLKIKLDLGVLRTVPAENASVLKQREEIKIPVRDNESGGYQQREQVRKVDGGFLTHIVKVAWEFELETTGLQDNALFHRT